MSCFSSASIFDSCLVSSQRLVDTSALVHTGAPRYVMNNRLKLNVWFELWQRQRLLRWTCCWLWRSQTLSPARRRWWGRGSASWSVWLWPPWRSGPSSGLWTDSPESPPDRSRCPRRTRPPSGTRRRSWPARGRTGSGYYAPDHLRLVPELIFLAAGSRSVGSHLWQLTPHADAAVGHFTGQNEEQVVRRQPQDAHLCQLWDGGDDSWWERSEVWTGRNI